MTKTFTASEAKTSFFDLLAKVAKGDLEVIVTKNGKPAAALISVDELTQLKETIDVLIDPSLMKQVAASRIFYKKNRRGLAFEDVFGEPLVPRRRKR